MLQYLCIKIIMYKCKHCDKTYEKKQAFIAHCRIHSGYVRPKKIKPVPVFICPHCNKVCENGLKLGGHITHCKYNPKYLKIKDNISNGNKNKDFKWSDEHKERISNQRIKYLNENPDKVPYRLNHSSKMSYPEIIFKNALEAMNITGWTYNFQHGIYSYDFAFPLEKIDIEIDGGTHTLDKVKKIDERRDLFSVENGWTVIRFPAKLIKKDVVKCVQEIIKLLNVKN